MSTCKRCGTQIASVLTGVKLAVEADDILSCPNENCGALHEIRFAGMMPRHCPFCGTMPDVVMDGLLSPSNDTRIKCSACNVTMIGHGEDLVDRWNRRRG